MIESAEYRMKEQCSPLQKTPLLYVNNRELSIYNLFNLLKSDMVYLLTSLQSNRKIL